MIITLVSIWISLFMSIFTLGGATDFWLKHSFKVIKITPLPRYPMITIVVPAHNKEVVIAQTTRAILDMNYPADRVELLLYADNCADKTADEMRRALADPRYRSRNVKIIERTGSGGKAGVLNDALKIAHGDYIGVYDADAMPEINALYFLVRKALENPERYVAVFGRNKARNAQQNFLTKCINQEIVVTQRIQHCAIWHLFRIGRIPGTNFIIQRQFVQEISGWRNGALTEDTDISFKIMQSVPSPIILRHFSRSQNDCTTITSSDCAGRRETTKWLFTISATCSITATGGLSSKPSTTPVPSSGSTLPLSYLISSFSLTSALLSRGSSTLPW